MIIIIFIFVMCLVISDMLDKANEKSYRRSEQRQINTEWEKEKSRQFYADEQRRIKKQKWQDIIDLKYSQTKNCIDVETYGKMLEYLKYAGLEHLKLESFYQELTAIIYFVLSDENGKSFKHKVTQEALKMHQYSNTINKICESMCMLWFNESLKDKNNEYEYKV